MEELNGNYEVCGGAKGLRTGKRGALLLVVTVFDCCDAYVKGVD